MKKDNGWIKCSESLPMHTGKYITTDELGIVDGIYYYVKPSVLNNVGWNSFTNIIAWMEMPEPYEVQEESEIERLRQIIKELEEDNADFQEKNEDLYIANKAFFKSNNELCKQVRRLKDCIATLEDKIEELKDEH